MRQAINALVTEGRLYRVQGSGTFVSEPATALHLAQRFSSFAEDMREMNIPFSSKILAGSVIRAEGRLLSKLGLNYSDKVIYLERLGWANSEPFVLAFSIQEIILSKLRFTWLSSELKVTAAMRMSLMGGNWLS